MTTGTSQTDVRPLEHAESPEKPKKEHWPRNAATDGLMPVDPNKWYTVLQVVEYTGTSHKYISETFIRWQQDGKEGVIRKR